SCCLGAGSLSMSVLHSTPTAERYRLSLHDALPIFDLVGGVHHRVGQLAIGGEQQQAGGVDVQAAHGDPARALERRQGIEDGRPADRKSTRLNSSHVKISYAVFRLKKKRHKQI